VSGHVTVPALVAAGSAKRRRSVRHPTWARTDARADQDQSGFASSTIGICSLKRE
jgi:hypothetical protein